MLGARHVLVVGATILGITSTLPSPTRADGSDHDPEWRMIGHDVEGSRSQPFEERIGRRNVARLKPTRC